MAKQSCHQLFRAQNQHISETKRDPTPIAQVWPRLTRFKISNSRNHHFSQHFGWEAPMWQSSMKSRIRAGEISSSCRPSTPVAWAIEKAARPEAKGCGHQCKLKEMSSTRAKQGLVRQRRQSHKCRSTAGQDGMGRSIMDSQTVATMPGRMQP